jgi:hypothetical protein
LVDARVNDTGTRCANTHTGTRNTHVTSRTGLIYSGIDYACTRCTTTRGCHTPFGNAHRLAINNRVGGRHDKQAGKHCNQKYTKHAFLLKQVQKLPMATEEPDEARIE